MRPKWLFLVVFGLIFILPAVPCHAQNDTGSSSGVVFRLSEAEWQDIFEKEFKEEISSGFNSRDDLRGSRGDSDQKALDYKKLFIQSHIALGIQHAIRIAFQEKTRRELGGPFLEDWFKSVRGFGGWQDGDGVLSNWIGHPLQGSASAFIFSQNYRQAYYTRYGDKGYWKLKSKQLLFASIYSEYFEIGPVSEASIGNVGLNPGTQGYIDQVVTPLVGMLLSVGEDITDKYIIDRVRVSHRYWADILTIGLNPGRFMANFVAGHRPSYRTFDHSP